ncbi:MULTISPECIES: ABC transporter ATP-binding protein [Cryobacterium]|uniref:ABC transporter ATP-binding protein n=1 Tax=Cryobacterium TaxID=69578 RepID=UPI000CD47250|nr:MULTISPECIES: ABC transporter ATP-binding protein [Cryobacterium]POH63464.1 ABC transporter [Cryobacterium zongtaii]TFC42200.1 ABC transporter ATP-binding protein [Cryobacterium sp. TMN-39-2]TFC89750.1 ABC transporter ATP-binding protein [Cryobacterium sp. TMT4-31]
MSASTATSTAARRAAGLGGVSERDRTVRPATTKAALAVEFAGLGRTFAPSSGTVASGAARPVLRDVSLTVRPGEVLAILGTSGCGKSTLLRIAGGLDSPSTGSVQIDGTPSTAFDTRCAVGFQEPRLLPWRTVAANVSLGLPRGTAREAGRARVAELLELVGLTAFAGHRPAAISGGMAQRASLARALARNPGVLLLDEPFGALDALTRLKMQDLLLDVHAAAPTTVLLVTHDVDEALQLADRIILLGQEPASTGAAQAVGGATTPGATIVQELTVPGNRPRDRGSAELAELRGRLLAGLGIDRHGEARGVASNTGIPHFPY